MILQIKILVLALGFTAGADALWEGYEGLQSFVSYAKTHHEPTFGKPPSGLRPF